MQTARFQHLGTPHLIALALTVVTAAGLSWLARRAPKATRIALGLLLLGMTAVYVVVESQDPHVTIWSFLPLHLCDMAIFVGAYALLTRRQAAYEVLYFWALTGTVLAMVFPEVWRAFPDWYFITYFTLHGGVVVAALTLTIGHGMRPRRHAPLRVLGWTALYAGGVGVVNAVFDTNYLYLCRKPTTPSPLDWFGPWPWYIGGAALFALACFTLLMLPFRLCKTSPGDASGAASGERGRE